MRRLLRTSVLLAAAAFALGSSPARAADDAAKREARARYDEGVVLHNAGREDEARLKFEQAYAIFPHPNMLFNLARSEQLTGKSVAAFRHYKQYQREVKSIPDDENKTIARYLDELTQKVGRIRVVAPADARVKIDDTLVDDIKEPIAVDVGSHTVTGVLAERTEKTEVVAVSGMITSATLAFGVPTATPHGDGPPVTPPPQPDATPSSARTVTAIVLFSAAGASLTTGIILRLMANGQQDTVDTLHGRGIVGSACAGVTSTDCQSLSDASDKRVTFSNVSTVGFVGAGVLALAGVGTLIFWPKDEAPKHGRVWVSPWLGSGGGAVLGGAF